MSEDRMRRPRSSRDETVAAILEAAEQLFSERGYASVSVRAIAAEAGISHALVHRYLGSKEEVYRTMLRRRETVIRDAAPEGEDLFESTRLMLHEAWFDQRRYLRLVTHSVLHGLQYSRTSGRFAATERLIGLAEQAAAVRGETRDQDGPDPRFVIASIVAMLLGWAAVKDWLLPAAGIAELGDEEFLADLERVMVDVERLYFPTAGAAAGD